MRSSFLTYSLAIFNRALPDCVDGLKTAQRRIVIGLNDLALRHDRPYKKVSRLEGHVLGSYHPQGGCANTAINMGQANAFRYTLTDIHGNAGGSIQVGPAVGQCISEDPPAAARYLEIRPTDICEKLFIDEINPQLGEWRDNYDGSTQELARIVPALPALLLNGSQGIASGYACYHIPYHLTDVVNATIAYVKNKSISRAALRAKFQGPPDFAQGGAVLKDQGLVDAMDKGSGAVRTVGSWRLDKNVQHGKRSKRDCLVITSLPYGSSESFLEKVKVLVDAGKLEGVLDVQDHSNANEGVNVMIVLRPGVSDTNIIKVLLANTNLSHVHSVNATAVVDGMPKVLGVKDIIQYWYVQRKNYLTERFVNEQLGVDKAIERLCGIEKVLGDTSMLVEILKKSKDRAAAVKSLRSKWSLSEFQAEEVLKTPLSRLIKTEIADLKAKIASLRGRKAEIATILASEDRLDDEIVTQITTFKGFSSSRRAKYHTSEAKTSLKTKKLAKT